MGASMSNGLSSTLAETLATVQEQKRATGEGVPSGPVAPELSIGLSFAPGARVLDLVTGEEGVILAGTIAHSLVPASKPAVGQGAPGQTSGR